MTETVVLQNGLNVEYGWTVTVQINAGAASTDDAEVRG